MRSSEFGERANADYLPPTPPLGSRERTMIQGVPHLLEMSCQRDDFIQNIAREYHNYSADKHDPIRLVQFHHFITAANALGLGDYLELGVFGGLTLKVIHKMMDPQRTLYGVDTFCGFDERDIAIEKTKYNHRPEEYVWFSKTSAEKVSRYVGDGTPPKNLKLIRGWFPEAFPRLQRRRWRFIHIDFDLYQPIKSALDLLWEPLLPGGFMLVHDYGCCGFPAARMAVDEFCRSIGLWPVELPDRWGTAVLRKP